MTEAFVLDIASHLLMELWIAWNVGINAKFHGNKFGNALQWNYVFHAGEVAVILEVIDEGMIISFK